MRQITHKYNKDKSKWVQIVSASDLRKVLDESGDDYERPKEFEPKDEWRIK